ncbi:hypothetical protein J4222_01140 [Candidatus Woesearchaeota archaeon]|nr:hypothetical protein [Candidatus Woesearchaeota archaeon]
MRDNMWEYAFLDGTKYEPSKHDELIKKPLWAFSSEEMEEMGLPLIRDTAITQKYFDVILAADKSKPTPDQSGFYVHTGGMTEKGNIVYGGNHEKGRGKQDTITHGEESVLARALDDYGIEDQISIIGFLREKGFAPAPRHCGPCRDGILKYDTSRLKVFGASKDGGHVVVLPFSKYLKEDFEETDEFLDFPGEQIETAVHGLKIASYRGLSGTPELEKKMEDGLYGAVIVAKNGKMWKGSFRGDTAYHSSYTISAAIDTFRNSGLLRGRDIDIEKLILVSQNSAPQIPYKDRQYFLDFAESVQLFNNRGDEPLPVYMLQADEKGDIVKGWKTDSYEWLPLPFSGKLFGLGPSYVKNIEALLI